MNPLLEVPQNQAQPDVAIRDLTSHEDLLACVDLQREVWGAEFEDCVPPALLKVTQRVGGLAAGAFDEAGVLLGFVYGITGLLNGRRVHWSHMLAVRASTRGIGIGRMLKQYQRRAVAERGAETIQWSFDPLVARNAHLNLNRLRAVVSEYVEAMYPPMSSKLHGTIPIDRLVVEWPTTPPFRDPGPPPPAADSDEPGARGDGMRPTIVLDWRSADEAVTSAVREEAGVAAVRIAVPHDFEDLVQRNPDGALEARLRTRAYFTTCLEHGYRIGGFDRRDHGNPHYLLYRS